MIGTLIYLRRIQCRDNVQSAKKISEKGSAYSVSKVATRHMTAILFRSDLQGRN